MKSLVGCMLSLVAFLPGLLSGVLITIRHTAKRLPMRKSKII